MHTGGLCTTGTFVYSDEGGDVKSCMQIHLENVDFFKVVGRIVYVGEERQMGGCCTAVPSVHLPTFSLVYSRCREGCAHSLLLGSVCVCLDLQVFIDTVGRKIGYLLDRLSLAQHFSITSIPLTVLVLCINFYFRDNC